MKIYAINNEGKVVELSFKSIEEADDAFNSADATFEMAPIEDSDGKTQMVNVQYGYSEKYCEMACVEA